MNLYSPPATMVCHPTFSFSRKSANLFCQETLVHGDFSPTGMLQVFHRTPAQLRRIYQSKPWGSKKPRPASAAAPSPEALIPEFEVPTWPDSPPEGSGQQPPWDDSPLLGVDQSGSTFSDPPPDETPKRGYPSSGSRPLSGRTLSGKEPFAWPMFICVGFHIIN